MKKQFTLNRKWFVGILSVVLCVLIAATAIIGLNSDLFNNGGAAINTPNTEENDTAKPNNDNDAGNPNDNVVNNPTDKPHSNGNSKPNQSGNTRPNAAYDTFDEFVKGVMNVSEAVSVKNQISNGATANAITVGGTDSGATAQIPQGVALTENVTALTLSVKAMNKGNAQVKPTENQIYESLDVHMDGVAADNTIPMLITLKHYLPMGLNNGNVQLYHVEQGKTLTMTQAAAPTNHNEFSYDPLTGNITLAMASFSEVALVADTNNPWDGTAADAFAGGSGTEADPYLIATAHQMAYFRNQVDAGITYEDKFVKLNNSINLGGVNFDPIGYGYESKKYMADGKTFNGTFDGGNRTISGLYQNGWELGDKYSYSMAGGGLFASVVEATIKNLKISGANIAMECVDMGVLVGYSQGSCTYENIGIYNSKIANYQRATGGLIGEVSPRRNADGSLMFSENTHTFRNISIGYDVVVGSLWGDFDASVGGVIGGRWDDNDSTKVVMENVTVACRLDVYNDITAAYRWHAYRRAGMLIGNTDTPPANGKTAQTATAKFLTCRNVDVHLGDWINYHYCQFTNSNNPGARYPWVRVEAGENCQAYSNPRYGQPLDVNDKKVADSNHTHKEGDTCHLLMPFAQLYGGGQGVYGAISHDGVTISKPVYTITYMIDSEVDEIIYVTDNSKPYDLKYAGDHMQWLDREGESLTQIPAGNIKSLVLHLDDVDKLIAHFLDYHGFDIAHVEFTSKDTSIPEPPVPYIEGYVGHWEKYTLPSDKSIVIKPVYTISDEYDELATTSDLKKLFQDLSEGKNVVMSQDLSGSQSNASQSNCAVITDPTITDKDARLNLNGYRLEYTFASQGNKSWLIFDIRSGSTLTVTGGIMGEGELVMNIEKLNNNANPVLFDLDPGATLILEKGTIIELHYPEGRANDVSMFGLSGEQFAINREHFPYIEYVHDEVNCFKRIVVKETTILVG